MDKFVPATGDVPKVDAASSDRVSRRFDAALRAWLALPLHDRLLAIGEDRSLMEYIGDALIVLDAHREEFRDECRRQDLGTAEEIAECLWDFEWSALNDDEGPTA